MTDEFPHPERTVEWRMSPGPPIQSWANFDLDEDGEWVVAVRMLPDKNGDLVVAELRLFPLEGNPTTPLTPPGRVGDERSEGEWSHSLDSIPDGGLRARDLRRIKLNANLAHIPMYMTDGLAEHIERFTRRNLARYDQRDIDAWTTAMGTHDVIGKGRGEDHPDLEYAIVAFLYISAVEADRQAPNKAVAAQLGKGWDATKVREWIRRARSPRRGILTGTMHGVAGGQLTDKAQKILDEAAIEEDQHGSN